MNQANTRNDAGPICPPSFQNQASTMRPESDTAANCQAEYGEEVKISVSSLTPNMAQNYRCTLVWDTRTNRDVGWLWLMVRKKVVGEMK